MLELALVTPITAGADCNWQSTGSRRLQGRRVSMTTSKEPQAQSVREPLWHRRAAESTISKFLTVQRDASPRTALQRILGANPLSRSSDPLFRSVVGDLEVGRALSLLGAEWTVLHSIPIGAAGWETDHLVIGPAGVFIVHTKNYTGQSVWVAGRAFMVEGHRLPHIRRAESDIGQVELLLGMATGIAVVATAVIAVMDPEDLSVRDLPRDIIVLPSRNVARWLARRTPALSPAHVLLLTKAASASTTWRHPGERAPDAAAATKTDAASDREYFDELRREVQSARFLRQAWIAAAALAVAGTLVVLLNIQLYIAGVLS